MPTRDPPPEPTDQHVCIIEPREAFDDYRRESDYARDDERRIDAVWGIVIDTDGENDERLHAFVYPEGDWSESAADEHCANRNGETFQPAEDDTAGHSAVVSGQEADHAMTTQPHTDKRTDDEGRVTEVRTTASPDSVISRTFETADGDEEERDLLRVLISSTRQDREGDAFSEQALRDMADQIRTDQPLVFDDHGGGLFGTGYSARETIGTQMDAAVEEAEDGHHELFAVINPDHSHEEGTRMLEQVRDERQAVKFSVGFGITRIAEDMGEADRPDRAEEIPGRLFMQADLMETSRVGIPANPDASVPQTLEAKGGGQAGGIPVALLSPDQLDAMTGQTEAATDGGTEREGATKDGADTSEEPGEGKPKCDSDADCPEGEVCRDGKCVPKDEDDKADTCPECGADVPDGANYCPQCGEELGEPGDGDDGEDSATSDGGDSSDDPDETNDATDAELRERIAEIEDKLSEGRGSPDTARTDVDRNQSPDPDADAETDTDETDDSSTDTEPIDERGPATAYEYSRSNHGGSN